MTEPAAPQPPFRQDEVINVFSLEAGRLPNLVLEFDGVGRAFDSWVHGERRKRGADGFRVLWLVNEGARTGARRCSPRYRERRTPAA